MRYIFILFIFIVLPVYSQEETGYVMYVDSINNSLKSHLKQTYMQNSDEKGTMTSREGKFIIKYTDNFFMTEGVKRCLRMSLDAWENKINIKTPIFINVTASEDIDPSVEIQTTVQYSVSNNIAYPNSFISQLKGKTETGIDEIAINAFVDWNTSWDNDNNSWGYDNLQTALLRHIGHLLGFGTSVVERNGGLGFATRRFTSPFDNLVSDGQTTLGSIDFRASSVLRNFLKKDLHLSTSDGTYKLFTSHEDFVPFRSGSYFSLPKDNILNYPYGDRSVLQAINDETLNVMEAMDWEVKPHDINIIGNNVDALGYGSIYMPHIFEISDNEVNLSENTSWTFQVYNNETKSYTDKQYYHGKTFVLDNPTVNLSNMDEFMCQQGRILCSNTTDGISRQNTFLLSLDARPHFNGIEILNKQDIPNTDYYSFDIKLSSLGTEEGDIIVSSDYGTLQTTTFGGGNETYIHVPQALKFGQIYLYINMVNTYGTTNRYITLDEYRSVMANAVNEIDCHADVPAEIYTINGMKQKSPVPVKSSVNNMYIKKHKTCTDKRILISK